jgi:ADP-heptose:LPS heptosyltransferase
VVLVRASRIGDFVCAVPAFGALRAALPSAEIALIGLPFVRDLCARLPSLDRFIPFGGFPGIAEQFFKPGRAVRFFSRMQAEKYDLAIQMHGTGVFSNIYALMLGARFTAGFIREGDSPGMLDAAYPMPASGHEVQKLLAFTLFLGAPPVSEAPVFPLLARDRARAQMLLADAGPPYIGLHLFARKPEKCWPDERFMEAARRLRADHRGTIVLIGGKDNGTAARTVAGRIGPACLDLTGMTSIGTLGAVVDRLAVLLTNDSGPAHIAYALGTPTVTVFGETDPERWGPPARGPFRVIKRMLPCSPCREDTCDSGYACLRSIGVDEVVQAATEVFGANARAA